MERPQQSSASSTNSNRPRRRFNKRSAPNFANTTALLKIVIRNWESLEQMEHHIAQLYSSGSYGLNFAFDEGLWRSTVQQQRKAIQATKDWKKTLSTQKDQSQLEDQLQDQLETEQVAAAAEDSSSICPALNADPSNPKASVATSIGPQISVRTLYIVPPKEMSRRGNRPGLAYFVWTVDPETNEHKDRSTLYRALEALQASTAILNGSDQQLIEIQEAVNGKAWKEPTTYPNEVATVFQTDHYKQFLQSSQDLIEQRLSRPKPSPGGGTVPLLNSSANLASTAPTALNATDEPVATLVQYLQQKHEEEKKRKAQRRKERKKQDDTAGTTNGSSTVSTKPASSKQEANGTSAAAIKKRTRRQRKKKNGKP